MNEYIKTLINANKNATKNITALESTIQNITVTTEKDKVNFVLLLKDSVWYLKQQNVCL